MGATQMPLVTGDVTRTGASNGAMILSTVVRHGPVSVTGRAVDVPLDAGDLAAILVAIAKMPNGRLVFRWVDMTLNDAERLGSSVRNPDVAGNLREHLIAFLSGATQCQP